jgi:AcrR family transcriptional regulator
MIEASTSDAFREGYIFEKVPNIEIFPISSSVPLEIDGPASTLYSPIRKRLDASSIISNWSAANSMKTADETLSRGHKKRERTRAQLIDAGVAVLAAKGEALTISDVVSQAQMSSGTFYNYFPDRDALMAVLAEHSVASFAAQAAIEFTEDDPARQFAFVTSRLLNRAQEDPTWARAILRLTDVRKSFPEAVSHNLRKDLELGFDQNRFAIGPDDVTLDLLTGLLMASIRRIATGTADLGYPRRVVERALVTLGIDQDEAARIAADSSREIHPEPE